MAHKKKPMLDKHKKEKHKEEKHDKKPEMAKKDKTGKC